MNTGLPYRPPAKAPDTYGWVKSTYQRGGCYQHWRKNEAAVKVLQNMTRVANYAGGADIPPYPREDTYSYAQGGPNANCGHTGGRLCGKWKVSEFPASCGSDTKVDLNCYRELADVRNEALCQKVGFKAVQARKVWHGEFAYQDPDRPSNWVLCATPSSPSEVKYLSKRFAISIAGEMVSISSDGLTGNKIVFAFDLDQTWLINANTGLISVTGTWQDGYPSQSGYTFFKTTDGGSTWVTDPDGVSTLVAGSVSLGQFANPAWASILCGMGMDCNGLIGASATIGGLTWVTPSTAADLPAAFTAAYPDPAGPENTWTLTANTASSTATSFTVSVALHSDYHPGDASYAIADQSFTVTYEQGTPYQSGTVAAESIALLSQWDLSDDKLYPWRTDQWTTVNPLVTRAEVWFARTLPDGPSDPATYTDAYDDADLYNFDGRIVGAPVTGGFPEMLTDGVAQVDFFVPASSTQVIPLTYPLLSCTSVKRYNTAGTLQYTGLLGTGPSDSSKDYYVVERGGSITTGGVTTTYPNGAVVLIASSNSCPDGLLSCNTGDYAIISYTTQAVAGGHFDRRHVNPKWYEDPAGSGHYVFDLAWYGAYSGGAFAIDPTDSVQPYNATQWTGCTDGQNQDAKLFPHGAFLMSDVNGCWAQKYAEVKLPWHSTRWFGPCGVERDQIVSVPGNARTCGGDPDVSCAWSGGAHRWPNAWPIECDRGAAFTDMGGGTVRVALDSVANYLRDAAENAAAGTGATGDKVDFTSADGLTVDDNGGAGYEVTDTDAGKTWFEFSGSVPAAAMVRVKSHGAPHFKWFDTDGKGEFLAVEHSLYDYRAVAIDPSHNSAQYASPYYMPQVVSAYSVAQHCLPFIRCFPAVMCYSPDLTETIDRFDNGVTLPFPDDFVMDARYTSRWSGVFVQALPDPWWLAPEGNCEPTLSGLTCAQTEGWTMDDGLGNDDNPPLAVYYAHYPVVEARDYAATWTFNGVTFTPPTPQTVVAGADAVYTNYLTLAQMRAGGFDGAVFHPGDAVGGPLIGYEVFDTPNYVPDEWAPWGLWLRMQYCICAERKFHEDYKLSLGCWMCLPEVAGTTGGPETTDTETETTMT